MQKVVNFYEKLPRGPAPEPEAKGLLGRYAKKHMGKNPSGRRKYICGRLKREQLRTKAQTMAY